MGIRTRLLLPGGLLAIVALLGSINISAAVPGLPPMVNSITHETMTNGCTYRVTVNANAHVIDLEADPPGASATVSPFEPCAVVTALNICETETGLLFCPPLKLGRQPIQLNLPWGTCYAPPDKKFAC